MSKFPRRDNGPSPQGSRMVTQDSLNFEQLTALFAAFEASNKLLPPDSPDRTVYVVHYVTGSPMASLTITPTKAGDD